MVVIVWWIERRGDRQVPRKPRPVGGVKGHNINEISFPGSPALWAGSFTLCGEAKACVQGAIRLWVP